MHHPNCPLSQLHTTPSKTITNTIAFQDLHWCKFWHIRVQAQTNLAQYHSQPLTVPFLTTTPIHFGSTFFGCFFVFPSLLFFEYMCLYYVSILYKDLSCNSQIKHPAVLFSSPVCSQSLAHSAHPHSFKFFIDLALLFLLHLPTVLAPLFCHVPTSDVSAQLAGKMAPKQLHGNFHQ